MKILPVGAPTLRYEFLHSPWWDKTESGMAKDHTQGYVTWNTQICIQLEGLFLVVVVKWIASLRMELTAPIYKHYFRQVYSFESYKEIWL
jgi:hypothetical protein